jgi:hypothetical protein
MTTSFAGAPKRLRLPPRILGLPLRTTVNPQSPLPDKTIKRPFFPHPYSWAGGQGAYICSGKTSYSRSCFTAEWPASHLLNPCAREKMATSFCGSTKRFRQHGAPRYARLPPCILGLPLRSAVPKCGGAGDIKYADLLVPFFGTRVASSKVGGPPMPQLHRRSRTCRPNTFMCFRGEA